MVRLVRGMVPHLYGAFFVETLDYLERSRRISKAQALLGTMLGIKPLLTVEEGEILPAEKVHTRERAAEKTGGIYRRILTHSQDGYFATSASIMKPKLYSNICTTNTPIRNPCVHL